jgi:hypothetical protein
MKRKKMLISVAALVAVLFLSAPLHSVEIKKSTPSVSTSYTDGLMVSVRVAGGNGSVLEPGERVKLTFQTNRDAYVVLYNIDSEGFVNLLYPRDGDPRRVEGNKVYFLPEVGSGLQWVADGSTGIEYIHAVAVADRASIREQELDFLARNRNQPEEERFRIDGDPFLSFNMIDEEIVGNAQEHPPATDYTYFYINREVDYPRYLCSKCHAPGKLTDPYNMDCPEIVVERYAYDEDVSYPYPPLFDITYVDGGGNEDYYASGKYIEKHFEDDYEEYDDTPIYLSIYYSNYSYPYRYYWPSYRVFWTSYYYNPFLWDYYWYWDFGFSYYFTDYYYHYWPFYTWYYPYSYYWAWDYYHYDNWRYYDCCYRDYRPLYSDRTLVKRTIDYTTTNTDLLRDRTISKSPLSQREAGNYARRADDSRTTDKSYDRSGRDVITGSRLADRTARKTITRSADYRNRIVTPKQRDPEKRVVHGLERLRDDAARRAADRNVPTRRTPPSRSVRKSQERSGSSGDRSSGSSGSSSGRKVDRSGSVRKNDASDRGTKSSGSTRGSSGRTTRSKETKKSDTKRETPSRSTSRTTRSTSSRSASRNSGTSPARGGSSGSSRSSGGSSGSGKTRRK